MDESRNNPISYPKLPIIGQPAPSAGVVRNSAWPAVRNWVRDEEALKFLGAEFAECADLPPEGTTRRQFLQVMGASVALATTSGCFNQPQEKIVPFVRAPEQIVPGKPLYYATATTLGGGSMGLLIETHMGRPTKVEGNPLHPAVPAAMSVAAEVAGPDTVRFGATDVFAQSAVLSLYDPDRSQTILRAGQISTWDALYSELRAALERVAPARGEGLRLLTPTVTSPTLASQLRQLATEFPNARWHQYEPVSEDNVLAGSRLAFGETATINVVNTPEIVLSLDCDCFSDDSMRLQYARRLRGQNISNQNGSVLPRLYVVETSSTITGAAADHRLPIGPRGVLAFSLAVARRLGLEVDGGEELVGDQIPSAWLDAVVEDLSNARGRSLVLAGRGQPPAVHAVTHWINETLDNVGQTIEYHVPPFVAPELEATSIADLSRAMLAKEVAALVILEGNPAYDAPADTRFTEALAEVPFSIHLSQYVDETSSRCTWHLPQAHLFESWTDTRAADGTASIVQPLIAPLYEGKTTHELVAAILGSPGASSHDIVRGFWQKQLSAAPDDPTFERTWETALHNGIVENSVSQPVARTVSAGFAAAIAPVVTALLTPSGSELQITFRPDPSVWDGRFANSGWLQEVPRPLTKLTWDNALLLSPQTATSNKIRTGNIVEVISGDARIELPAYVLPGHPDQTLTLHLGYGRKHAGRVGNGVGIDVYPLRTSAKPWFAEVTALRNTGQNVELASTQHHHHMAGRDLVRSGTLAEYLEAPDHPAFMATHHGHDAPLTSMYPPKDYDGYKWGMVVNQSACIGCNACVIACQSENNVPVVGRDQVARGREMQWLRIDSYYHDRKDEPANPNIYHQPVMCMHCEMAPCEPVCPVAATTHSSEGLNEMTYNRCVGTRYCSNNCPYKVRRFNFFDYNVELREDKTLQLLPNPDVTVRSRGVMEKCTFCVQRINAGRIAADIGNRSILDGEILTACQASCPTQALTFGNLNDANSAVKNQAESSLNYSLLGELNTRPRTTYLALVRNPNPKLA